ncbi:MAG: class B sortase [Oscillospiraceae bacterium]|nr:class B sortase [Oscillospiraceae bacterium]
MKKNKKSKTKTEIILDTLIVLLVGVMLFSGYKLVTSLNEYRKGRAEYDDIRNQMIRTSDGSESDPVTDGYLRFDFNGLRTINPDFKCWIDIPGTRISYPVVQGKDNDYYLRRTFSGNWNVGGVIFLDYNALGELNGKNTVIYGHRMNDGSMFTDLKKFLDRSFAEENREVHLYREGEVLIYTIFSASKTDVYCDCYQMVLPDDETFMNWIASQVARSEIDFGVIPDENSRILTLSTCVGNGEETGRYVVQAVLTSIISR